MATGYGIPAEALAVLLVAAQVAPAYEHPLGSHSIREAYFLGNRKDDKAAKFLAQYVKRLPLPKKGPHVAEIELLTPYAQVVLRAFRTPGGYSAQQAEQNYAAQPDRIRVRVRINLTPTYPGYLVGQGVRERPPVFGGTSASTSRRARPPSRRRRSAAYPYTSPHFRLRRPWRGRFRAPTCCSNSRRRKLHQSLCGSRCSRPTARASKPNLI